MFHVYRVSVEDSARFLRVSVPFCDLADAEVYAERLRFIYPPTFTVTVTERDENVKPIR